MRIERAKTNMTIKNKVNGKYYKIAEVSPERSIAYAVDENNEVLTGEDADKVVVTEANGICFCIVADPNAPEIPKGYWVDNYGTLMADTKKATEQGELKINRILSALPGYLVLDVVSKDNPERSDVFFFEPELDRFKKVGRNLPEIIILWESEDFCVLGTSETETKTETQEDGTVVEKQMFVGAEVIVIREKKVSRQRISTPLMNQRVKIIPCVDGFDFNMLVLGGFGFDMLIPFNSKVDSETGEIVDTNDFGYQVLKYPFVEEMDPEDVPVIITGEPVTVTRSYLLCGLFLKGKNVAKSVVLKYNGNSLCINDGITISSPKVEELKDFTYLVDIDTSPNPKKPFNKTVTFTLSDAAYNVATITRESTRDRGNIITVNLPNKYLE